MNTSKIVIFAFAAALTGVGTSQASARVVEDGAASQIAPSAKLEARPAARADRLALNPQPLPPIIVDPADEGRW